MNTKAVVTDDREAFIALHNHRHGSTQVLFSVPKGTPALANFFTADDAPGLDPDDATNPISRLAAKLGLDLDLAAGETLDICPLDSTMLELDAADLAPVAATAEDGDGALSEAQLATALYALRQLQNQASLLREVPMGLEEIDDLCRYLNFGGCDFNRKGRETLIVALRAWQRRMGKMSEQEIRDVAGSEHFFGVDLLSSSDIDSFCEQVGFGGDGPAAAASS